MELTNTNVRYLLTIYKLIQENGKARSIDIAIALGLARPTVHRMLCTLSEMGFICKQPRQSIQLTEKGLDACKAYQLQYDTLCQFLNQTLGLPLFEARESAFCLLNTLSDACIEKLLALNSPFYN